MKKTVTILALLLTAALGLVIQQKRLTPIPKPPPAKVTYPKLAQYVALRWNGEPFAHGMVMDTARVDSLARFKNVILDDNHSVIQHQIHDRLISKGVTLMDYFDAGQPFQCGQGWYGQIPIPYGCDTTQFAWKRWNAIGREHGLVWSRLSGVPYRAYGNLSTDFAIPGLSRSLATAILAWYDSTRFAGIFIDETARGMKWTQSLGDSIDFYRDGFVSVDDWDEAYRAGVDSLYAILRAGLGTRPLIGNGGPVGAPTANGWMWENFPYQPGESAGGYVASESLYVQPAQLWLTVWHSNVAEDARRGRFALGVACLGNGLSAITGGADDAARGYVPLWLPEYGMKLGTPSGRPTKGHQGEWVRYFSLGAVAVSEGRAVLHFPGYRRLDGTPADTLVLGPEEAAFLLKGGS